jgi:hypothetical protein
MLKLLTAHLGCAQSAPKSSPGSLEAPLQLVTLLLLLLLDLPLLVELLLLQAMHCHWRWCQLHHPQLLLQCLCCHHCLQAQC